MVLKEPVKLTRDCDAVMIPDGLQIRLARNTEVRVMQALGSTFTVMTEYGTMVRIDGKDAEAIGEMKAAEAAKTESDVPATADDVKEKVWIAMRGVYDPEIPINVVDLGLVYKNEVTALPEGGYKVDVNMTLTAPGCGMGNVLKEDAEIRIRQIPGIKTARVEIVIEPAWNQSMMSEAAKLELGLA